MCISSIVYVHSISYSTVVEVRVFLATKLCHPGPLAVLVRYNLQYNPIDYYKF